MINRQRLAETFKMLVEIDSVSTDEAEICEKLKDILSQMGAQVIIDGAAEKAGANTGNLIAKFKGNVAAPPLLLNAHMDTVEPGRGVHAVLDNGCFTSDGSTILGADDKSAIAILLETLTIIQENRLDYGPLELVLTICEEVGLVGAKTLDYGLLEARYGYTLDTKDINAIVNRAPASNKFYFKIHGKDAHAGVAPEQGINAIQLAATAISKLTLGRLDEQTTCNIGIIEGGIAINIVPSLVTIKGEARSHDETRLEQVTRDVVAAFESVIDTSRQTSGQGDLPRLEYSVESEFRRTHIPEDHPVVQIALESARKLGRDMELRTTGGGADANVFFEKGIYTAVLGTGMQDMHSVRESIRLDDMVATTELMLEIIRRHSEIQAATAH